MPGMPIRRARREARQAELAEQALANGVHSAPPLPPPGLRLPPPPEAPPVTVQRRESRRGRPSLLSRLASQVPTPAAPTPVPDRKRDAALLAQHELLDSATELALKRAKAVLEIEINPEDKHYMRLLGLQQQAMALVLGLQSRVDDSKLRKKGGDRMGQILDRLKAAKG